MKIFVLVFLAIIPSTIFADIKNFHINNIEISYTLPKTVNSNTRIMVLFGGRNWEGKSAIKRFKFGEIADRYSLILISPSFKDNNYWEPQKWSGDVLKRAVKFIEKEYKLKPQKLLFYGYSAGGQCANLFYNYMPNQVEAWGLHACGVYPQISIKQGVQAFITCGENDSDRVHISKTFIYKYRENGGKVIWKMYSGGHELNKEALDFAHQFFSDILEKRVPIFIGEDDTKRTVPMGDVSEIDIEFRNYLTSEKLKKLWEAK